MAHQIYAVIGDPIAHSLSPVMQNAAFQAAGVDAEYIAVHVLPEDIAAFVNDARKHLAGFNITVPHKKAVIPFLDDVASPAKMAGSVNTVTIQDTHLTGCSTDGYGLEAALRESFGYEVAGHDILFIGCGGAVRAVAFYFAAQGLRKMYILNRTLSTAETLTAELKEHFPALQTEAASLSDLNCVQRFLNSVPTAVQCTSLGLKPDDPSPVPLKLIPQTLQLFDTIYKPTPLMRYCKEHGIEHAAGLSMLLHQGARSFSIWTGLEAPLEAMRAALPVIEGI